MRQQCGSAALFIPLFMSVLLSQEFVGHLFARIACAQIEKEAKLAEYGDMQSFDDYSEMVRSKTPE